MQHGELPREGWRQGGAAVPAFLAGARHQLHGAEGALPGQAGGQGDGAGEEAAGGRVLPLLSAVAVIQTPKMYIVH